MFKGLTPIVRGRCTECGFTRNLWVKEIGETIPCNHREDGCPGEMEAAYTGPKKFMPSELESSACTCAERKAREAAASREAESKIKDCCCDEVPSPEPEGVEPEPETLTPGSITEPLVTTLVTPIIAGTDAGSGAHADFAYYAAAELPDGWLMAGHGHSSDAVLIVQEGPFVQPSTGWLQVWTDAGSGKEKNYTVWLPTCEDPDYCALGVVCVFGTDEALVEPDEPAAMVHRSCCVAAELGEEPVWTDAGIGANADLALSSTGVGNLLWPSVASAMEEVPEPMTLTALLSPCAMALFEHKVGALAGGNDIDQGTYTLDAAKVHAQGLDSCVGFTFYTGGRAIEEVGQEEELEVYFKSSTEGNDDPEWQTFLALFPEGVPPEA